MKTVPRLVMIASVLLFSTAFPVWAAGVPAISVFDSPTAVPPTPTATPVSYQLLGNHTVKAGESLYCIGRAYGMSPWTIASVNKVAWPYTIQPGAVLVIPKDPWINIPSGPVCVPQFGGAPTPTPAPTATPGGPTPTPIPVPGCSASYLIRYGDTLLGISRAYHVNLYTLAARNYIYNLNLIYAGTTLCIP